jgi:hypothetical protein
VSSLRHLSVPLSSEENHDKAAFSQLPNGLVFGFWVTQELLRHANSRIMLDVYTQAVNSNKRAAQSKVVKMMVSSEATKAAIVGTTDSRK